MGAKSKIEWTGATWNPIVGCSIVSPGCKRCYAMKMAGRLEAMATARTSAEGSPGTLPTHYVGTTRQTNGGAVWTGKLALAPEHILTAPLRWNRPRRIFVNSMGDLFHERVPDGWIDEVFVVMAETPRHTFQVLTKRAERMRAYVAGFPARRAELDCHSGLDWCKWPLPNVWLGVSTEDQKRAEERVPLLLATPAAVRFVSAEPLLGPIDFRRLMLDEHTSVDAITGWHSQQRGPGPIDQVLKEFTPLPPKTGRLHQIITGGESGPNARPMHPQWARNIRDQCGFLTAFFHKQNGEWLPHLLDYRQGDRPETFVDHAGCSLLMRRVGKKLAGRLLDGREHNDMPLAEGRA